jgi:hypothetical protein
MTTVLWLLALQGVIGAFDTLYYHEWRARLPARVPASAPELRLHAVRNFLYAVLFATLPWLAWQGLWALVLAAILLSEIMLTLADFVVEKRVRQPLGDVFAGERVTHAVMGIIYGAMAANLLPVLWQWWRAPTGLVPGSAGLPMHQWALTAMALGVLLAGLRDLYAALGLPHGGWPWRAPVAEGRANG